MTAYGYQRVSTDKKDESGNYIQTFDLQTDALLAHGIPRELIFEDRLPGDAVRPGVLALLREVKEGDVIVVWRLDRLGRNAREILNTAHELKGRGVSIRSIVDGVDTSGPMGRFTMIMLAGFAELEKETIRERVIAGIASARAQGIKFGPKFSLSPAAREDVIRSYAAGESVQAIGRRYRVSRHTIYRVIQRAQEAA